MPDALARDCHDKLLDSGRGYAQKTVTMPAGGLAGARLTAQSGDWDVAIFDKRSGRTVSASNGFGAREVAEGFAGGGRELVIQACRRTGGASTASLNAFSIAVPSGTAAQRASLVRVKTSTPAAKTLLNTLVSETPTRAETYHNQTQTAPNQIAGEGVEGTYEDVALDVRESDQAKVLSLELTGDNPADDYDLELYRRVDGELVEVASSGNPANPELIMLDDPPVGECVLRVVNWLAAAPWTVEAKWLAAGPDEVTPGQVEAWTLTCERPDGVTVARKVVMGRGESQALRPCNA